MEPPKGIARRIRDIVVGQWFLITLGILIAISSQVQVPAAQQRIKQTVITYLCVSMIFFITGCTLPSSSLLENYWRWKLHLFVQLQSFLLSSAVFFAVVSAAASRRDLIDPGLLLGMIMTGCVPTTISSNVVMTRQSGGNTALTVVESTLGNFLGPFLTPPLFYMYTSGKPWYAEVLPADPGGYEQIYRRVFKQLGLSVFLPLVVGQCVQNLFPKPTKTVFVKYRLAKLSSFCLLVIIWQTYDQAFSSGTFDSLRPSNVLFTVLGCVGIFVAIFIICLLSAHLWLSKEDAIACCYCVPAKGPAMGIPLISVIFIGIKPQLQSQLQIPLVIYQGLQILAGTIMVPIFRKWLAQEKPEEEEARLAPDVDADAEPKTSGSGATTPTAVK
ncbi:sodium bile acid symporter family protein [Trichodelitschia bisporula]|uniref:Sodium bile acid symporter family protein n=1 Tax=Trichodelitschia bisporula TaxID=703511 RepID=A0A6G1HLH4_9PEZI|nr:sodium bile acid symporter family protein [Trichodelitschia bisporula]